MWRNGKVQSWDMPEMTKKGQMSNFTPSCPFTLPASPQSPQKRGLNECLAIPAPSLSGMVRERLRRGSLTADCHPFRCHCRQRGRQTKRPYSCRTIRTSGFEVLLHRTIVDTVDVDATSLERKIGVSPKSQTTIHMTIIIKGTRVPLIISHLPGPITPFHPHPDKKETRLIPETGLPLKRQRPTLPPWQYHRRGRA